MSKERTRHAKRDKKNSIHTHSDMDCLHCSCPLFLLQMSDGIFFRHSLPRMRHVTGTAGTCKIRFCPDLLLPPIDLACPGRCCLLDFRTSAYYHLFRKIPAAGAFMDWNFIYSRLYRPSVFRLAHCAYAYKTICAGTSILWRLNACSQNLPQKSPGTPIKVPQNTSRRGCPRP